VEMDSEVSISGSMFCGRIVDFFLQVGVKKALEMDRKNLLGPPGYISNCERNKGHMLAATNSNMLVSVMRLLDKNMGKTVKVIYLLVFQKKLNRTNKPQWHSERISPR
jgi:hypothetical protein